MLKVLFEAPSSLEGMLRVPSSKSYTHRAYFTALVAGGGTIWDPLASDDTDATLRCLNGFRTRIHQHEDAVVIDGERPPTVQTDQFDVDESGTLLRFLVPLSTVVPGPDRVRLIGQGTLRARSNRNVVQSMRKAGFRLEATGADATVPLTCYPDQSIPSEPIPVRGATTSQLVSGWLIALAARVGGRLRLTGSLVSEPYVEMTAQVLRAGGFVVDREESTFVVDASAPSSLEYTVPGDYSSAAFLVVAAVTAGQNVILTGLDPEDPQADRRIVDLLQDLGAPLEWSFDDSVPEGPALRVKGPFRPSGFTLNAVNCPDLVPVLAVLGSRAEGDVELKNLKHLDNKESNRIRATARELERIGVSTQAEEDRLVIREDRGSSNERVTLDSHGDHRLAMAFSVLGLSRGNVVVKEAECVSKSYPGFYRDLRALGARFEVENGGAPGTG